MAANQGDVWKINGEDRAKHDAQFFQLKPINGFISGNQARDFFMQSGLPTLILGQIWGLADINGDGKMDKKEFSVAMHLIKKKLQGYALPKVLPHSLKADPTPVIGSLGQSGMNAPMGANFSMGAMPNSMVGGMSMQGGPMPMMQQQPQASLGTATMTTGSLGGLPRMANGGTMQPSPGAMALGTGPQTTPMPAGGSIWAMPHNNRLKHTQTFNATDRNKRGYLLGVEGRSILMQSGLPQQVLAQIWTLSDVDQDGKLTCDEFCIAMHLTELARMGHAMPTKLPAELLPTKTRSGSITSSPPPGTPLKKDAFGELLGGIDMPKTSTPIVPTTSQPVEELAPEKQITLEDKRKENFDKGQAELERRRAMLREQQQQEANARLEKERQEAEKRERQRLEVESRRQAELQRQLEKQREKEREIEEQRRKMLEQREAARRELDRRRQMEWEAQRKEQLLQEKRREYEQLSVLKTQMANLRAELESLDGKKTELSLKITQVQAGVADFTSSIDGMRVSRDRALADIDLFDKQSKELDRKMSGLGSEKDGLNVQVQSVQATPLSDAHKTVSHSVELKRASIERLKKDVEQVESDTEARLGEIDCNNAELKNLKDQLSKLQIELPKLQRQQEERLLQQKKAAEELQQKQRLEKEKQEKLKREIEQQQKKTKPAAASVPPPSEPSWADFNSSDSMGAKTSTAGSSSVNWDTAFSGSDNSMYGNVSSAWGATDSSKGAGFQQKTKYRALYEFVASREDELSFPSGGEIMVLSEEPVSGMEDWFKGEFNGVSGWFPKAYVEKIDSSQPVSFGSAFEPVTQSSTQNQSNDLFSTNFSKPESSAIVPPTSSSVSASPANILPSDSPAPSLSSESLLAKATYPWKARQESDLTFDKDDVILVKKQEEMRWFGELNGKSGWFPKAYVKPIGVAPKTDSSPVNAETNHLNISTSDITSSSQTESQNGGGEYYVAMYSYQSEEPNDLNFSEGEMILLTGKNGDWWSGSIPDQGKSGIFPANYVKKLDIQPTSGSQLPAVQEGKEASPPSKTPNQDDFFASAFAQSPTTSSQTKEDPFASSFDQSSTAHSDFREDPFASVFGSTAEMNNEAKDDPFGGMLDFNTPVTPPSTNVNRTDAFASPHTTPAPLGTLSSLTFSDDVFSSMTSPMTPSDGTFSGMTSPTMPSYDAFSNMVSPTTPSDGTFSGMTSPTMPSYDAFSNMVSPTTPSDGTFSGMTSPTMPSYDAFSNMVSPTTPSDGTFSGMTSPTTPSYDAFSSMASPTTSNVPNTTGEDFWSLGAQSKESNMGISNNSTKSVSSVDFNSDPFGNVNNAFTSDPFDNTDKSFSSDMLGKDSFANDDDEITNAFEMGSTDKSSFGSDPFGNVVRPSSEGGKDIFGEFGKPAAISTLGLMQDLIDGRSKSAMGPVLSSTPGISTTEPSGGMSKSLDNLLDDVMPFGQTGSVFGIGMKGKSPNVAIKVEGMDDVGSGFQDNPEQKCLKKPEIARVIAPYMATGTGQLSLETGNLINVRQKSPRGWWEGELQVRGQKKKIGWFPANYVKLLGAGSARSTPEPSAVASLTVGALGSRSATPQSIHSQDGVPGINQPETVIALYAYQAQNDDELTFQKDAVITVLSRDNPDWWNGQLDGVTGVFPSNYVTPNPQSQSWMNDNIQEEMTKSERKRQQVIQELIATEESYNSDMQVALEVFKKPMIESNILPVEDVNQIFVNWEELIVCNKKLLQALRVRKKMSGKNGVIQIIGDLLCESIPHMNPYMRFCSCQLNAAAALQKASESNPSFQEFHKASMQNPKVKGVHLSGFLLRPMQRITRYPLLIEKILAHTPPEHADRTNVEEALSSAQELCSQVNQCVKEKQNSDHLEWIQTHVHCDGLAENIVFNSLTNCLGPRRLLFSGILYKAKSNKELVGFLFNDIFLLAQTSRPLGTNFSALHLFDTNMQFKMYRLPIFLNEVSVKKCPDETEPTQFQITSDRILHLKAVSSIERETWMREIESASKNYKDKAKRKLERAHSGLWWNGATAMRANPVGRALVVVEEGVGLWCPDGSVKRPNVGRIVVVIEEALQLKPSNANGKSDPYCEVSMGSQEHRTKVIPGTLNPRWNASMQFFIRDVDRDTLCFTVYDRDLFSPNDFLGRTEVRIKDVLDESGGERRGPITRRLILHEVETGEVVVKLDLLLYES